MEATHDEMTTAFSEQLNDDLAKKAESQSNTQHVWDEGYYLAQYEKHTVFKSEIAEFTRKDGSGTFKNALYNVPVGMFKVNLLGFAGRKGDAIVEWDQSKGYTFRATFDSIVNDKGNLIPESVNGGLLLACAKGNGFVGTTTTALLDWLANHMVVMHIGKMRASADGKYPAKNVIRAIRPHNG